MQVNLASGGVRVLWRMVGWEGRRRRAVGVVYALERRGWELLECDVKRRESVDEEFVCKRCSGRWRTGLGWVPGHGLEFVVRGW